MYVAGCDQVASRLYKMQAAVIFVRSILGAMRRAGARWLALFDQLRSAPICTFAPERLGGLLHAEVGASPNATSIASLYDIILVLAIVVFLVVMGFVVYSVCAFRAQQAPGGRSRSTATPGWSSGLTLTAVVILVVIATVTFIKLPGIVNPPNSDASAELGAVGVVDGTEPAQRAEADHLRHRPAVHLALHVRHRLQQAAWQSTSFRTPTRRWSFPRE